MNDYTWKKRCGRRLKSSREIHEEANVRVGCYMFVSHNRWIKEAWKQETRKESYSVKN